MGKVSEKDKQLLLLKSTTFFKSFSDADCETLLQFSRIEKYSKGRYIIRENSFGDSFYVILKGQVEVVKESKQHGTIKLVSLSNGMCFGEMAVLLKEARTASIRAEDDTFIFEIRLADMQKVDPDVGEKLFYQFAVTLAQRLEFMNTQRVKGE